MQILLSELTNGVTEQDANGNMVTRPPTLLMLRAARALKQLEDIRLTNEIVIARMEKDIHDLHEQDMLNKTLINTTEAENESLRKRWKETGHVGGDWPYDKRSDPTSEAGDKPEGGNPGTD